MKALIIYGGWQGHEPEACAKTIATALKRKRVTVTMSETFDVLNKISDIRRYDVIVPIWTMGSMEPKQFENLNKAVRGGVGLAGFHGGMGDSMRGNLEFNWMVGGQFVGHPYVGDHDIYLTDMHNGITKGMPSRFTYNSEQYYMIVDPGNNVLAETLYDYDGHTITMPCIWTKNWGKGRIFYSALGHVAKEFRTYKHVLAMTIRGIIWAGESKKRGTGI